VAFISFLLTVFASEEGVNKFLRNIYNLAPEVTSQNSIVTGNVEVRNE
jgi:hypothetical protein